MNTITSLKKFYIYELNFPSKAKQTDCKIFTKYNILHDECILLSLLGIEFAKHTIKEQQNLIIADMIIMYIHIREIYFVSKILQNKNKRG